MVVRAYPLFLAGFSEVSAFVSYELGFVSGSLHNIIGKFKNLLLQIN